MRSQPSRVIIWVLLLFLFTACAPALAAGQPDFAFVVMGDTRSEPFLPGGAAQADQMAAVVQQRFRTAGELHFNPQTAELDRVVLPGKEGKPDTVYFYRHGWPVLAQRGGQTFLRRAGQDWVYRRVIAEMQPQGPRGQAAAQFVLHSGDLPLWGMQGVGYDESPDYQDLYDRLLRWLPPVPPGFSLPGRFFVALGNHETWGDEGLKGVTTTLPHLAQIGFSPNRRIYTFDYAGCRFIFLDSGPYKGDKEGWYGEQPDFTGQMQALTAWLEEAALKGMRQVFVSYHKPSFCISGHGPLPQGHNPHPYLKPFAKRLSITVFNGHVHTTELYQVDGVRYLLLGAGGAPQVLQANPAPAGYPSDLYWRGQPRVEEYNYLRAEVTGNGLSMFLTRFRPGQPGHPIEKLEVFGQ